MAKVTMRDIAREAGVATSTVSYALGGNAALKDETRERILEVADRLGYKPRIPARRQKHNSELPVIALLLPGGPGAPPQDYHYLAETLRGATEVAQDFGFIVTVLYEKSRNPQFDAAELCRTGAVKGMLITGQKVQDGVVEELMESCFPVVLMEGSISRSGQIVSVGIDNEKGAFQATEHLIILGHKEIAMLRPGPEHIPFSAARFAGYKRALEKYGIPFDEDLVADGGLMENLAEKAMGKLLDLPVPPTAVFAGNDTQAFGAMKAARKRNLAIPDDLAVIGFDDMLAAHLTVPPLTTMHMPEYRMGSEGARVLIRKILRPEIKPETHLIPAELVIRESCGIRTERRS